MPQRQVFYSFHYAKDYWRTQMIRNIGMIDGSKPVSSNEWEEVKRKGRYAIENWIKSQLSYRTCLIVLVGEETYNREWIRYEIQEAWRRGLGVMAIHIHNLKDACSLTSREGRSPFYAFYINKSRNAIREGNSPLLYEENMGYICKSYNPPSFYTSQQTYNYIASHLSEWVEEAIRIRNKYPK